MKKGQIQLRRSYEMPGREDGYRVLVDRIWPRGISKEELKIDDWLKDIAPSSELREWFGHEEDRWPEFKKRYYRELKDKEEDLEKIHQKLNYKVVTFVYSAKDEKFNNAVALKEYFEKKYEPRKRRARQTAGV